MQAGDFLNIFNICIGVLTVASILLFFGGFIQYLVFLGSDFRERGLHTMAWGATILFVAVVLVAIVDVLQGVFFAVLGMFIVVFAAVALAVGLSKETPAPKKE